MNYIKLTSDQAIQLNNIMYSSVVSADNGVTFMFPFEPGTMNYINPTAYAVAYPVDVAMLAVAESNSTVASLITGAVDKATAVANGWVIDDTRGA